MTTTTTTTAVNIERALQTPDLRWPFPEELQWLAEQASTRKRIVEVGAYLGRSTIAMAENTQGTVYAWDDWYGPRDIEITDEERGKLLGEFLTNTMHLRNVRPIQADHADVDRLPIEWLLGGDDEKPDMVFIDGAHDYESVKRDLLIWRARLAPSGLLCGHDRNDPGVRQAINELCPGWKAAPGMIWYWTPEVTAAQTSAASAGLRKMDISELKLIGTADPAAEHVARDLPTDAWQQFASPGEIPTRFGVAVLLPTISRNADGTPRFIPPEWGIGLALQAPIANTHKLILSIKDLQRDKCREALIEQAMVHDVPYGYFQDDDVVPPPDVLQRLQYVLENADDDVAVAAGIYTTKSDPAVPLVFQDMGIGPFWKWRRGEVFECKAIATGCMMIRLSIFKSLPKPWFVDVHGVEHARSLGLYDGHSRALPMSSEWTDDMYFCWKLRKTGLRMMAHGGVLASHWGQDGREYTLAADSYPLRGGK